MPGVTSAQKWTNRHTRFNHSNDTASQHRQEIKNHTNGYLHSDPGDSKDYPFYILEHLATFSVGAQYGINGAADGLRRLLQMEKTSGIWTQKMQMRLERNSLVIIDNENGDIVERFPMSLISEPSAYTSNDNRELYNNVLVFVVEDDPANRSHNPPEMHIFQCSRVSAQEVVNEMKLFMSGKWRPKENGHSGRQLPPPPLTPPPAPPVNGVSVRETVNLFNAVAAAHSSPPKNDGMSSRGNSKMENRMEREYARDSNDETSSTSSDKYERDVAILNHCFDDIERFIARLQHSAAAYKELERRQKSRKNKKKDMGDGMLSIRAKPPAEKEFVDILQKFKLSFNLLAKLKSHIHDPNAPELVHFLFTPLALVVDAARDCNYSTQLAARVVSPLLTRDACDLLINCCTSKETELWRGLGESWITPRDEWEGFEYTFHPVFSDGWAPENPIPDDRHRRDHHEEHETRSQEYRSPSRGDRDSRQESEPYEPRATSPQNGGHSSLESSRYYSSSPQDGHRRPPYDRTGAGTPGSDLSADSIDRADRQSPFERQQKLFLDELLAKGGHAVQVLFPRTANNDKELSVLRGEYLEVLDDSRKWWKAKNSRNQVGHVPNTIVGPPDEQSPPPLQSEPSENGNRSSRPIPIQPAPADWVRRERQGKKGEFRYF